MEGALIAVIFLAIYSSFLTIGILGYFGYRHYKHKKLKVKYLIQFNSFVQIFDLFFFLSCFQGSDKGGGQPSSTKAAEEGRTQPRLNF